QDPADGAEPQGRAGVRARAVAAARRRARARGGARGARGAPAPAREGVMERGPGERSTPDPAPAGAGWPSLILGAFALVLLAGVFVLNKLIALLTTWVSTALVLFVKSSVQHLEASRVRLEAESAKLETALEHAPN